MKIMVQYFNMSVSCRTLKTMTQKNNGNGTVTCNGKEDTEKNRENGWMVGIQAERVR